MSADLILVMENQHKQELQRVYPYACGKAHLLGKWGNFEISDPYGEDVDVFERCFELIKRGCKDWQQRMV